jgi:hypothetical protein
MKHEVGLDRSSKKFICPGCGKKRFVRYFNYTTQEYFPDKYGRCDREVNCGYQLGIKDYFSQNNPTYNWKPKVVEFKKPTVMNLNVTKPFATNYGRNNFIQFLKTILPEAAIKEIVKKYQIGTSEHWPGATIFWQVDNNYQVRSGKILLYNADTGRRVKKPFNHITWYHKTKSIPNFNLSQCLFGLHLTQENPRKTISIVESEKTACIMSVLAPETIWLATGSLSNLNSKLLHPIIDRNIILYPDASLKNRNGQTCFDLWSDKAMKLKNIGYNISVSDLLHKKAGYKDKEFGYDLADFFIPQLQKKNLSQVNLRNVKSDPIELVSKEIADLNYLRKLNPLIDQLIEAFDLQLGFSGK